MARLGIPLMLTDIISSIYNLTDTFWASLNTLILSSLELFLK